MTKNGQKRALSYSLGQDINSAILMASNFQN